MRGALLTAMTGTSNQIELAEQIRPQVNAEFDRVANAFREVARTQLEGPRTATNQVLEILEEKRCEVMARPEAGYFIRDWRELGGQVRSMIAQDPRYRAIQAARQGKA